jgi:hypothetical protein
MITPIQLLALCIIVVATLAGSFFNIWRRGATGSMLSGAALLVISGMLAFTGEHALVTSLLPTTYLALFIGLAFGLTFPCCAPRQQVGFMQLVGSLVVVVHSILDGHLVREATTTSLLALLILHKFQDGADGRLFGSDNRVVQLATRIVMVAATPIGFFLIPEAAVPVALHSGLFAAVIGLNLGSSFHLFKHALHLRHAIHATT